MTLSFLATNEKKETGFSYTIRQYFHEIKQANDSGKHTLGRIFSFSICFLLDFVIHFAKKPIYENLFLKVTEVLTLRRGSSSLSPADLIAKI